MKPGEKSKTAPRESMEEKKPAVEYVHTVGLPEFLRTLGVSFIVTTYQAQRILCFSVNSDRLSMLMRLFERPTGLAVSPGAMAICAKNAVWMLETASNIRDEEGKALPYDRCYAPRASYVTGDIAGHELAWVEGELTVVNTRFSCLCTLSPHWSFVPIWKPPFISELVAEDRCHLNGMAVEAGQIRYLTALAETNEKEGWRECKRDGGIVMEYPAGEIIARGLAMPHSPRLHQGRLYVLESGQGELQVIDRRSGVRETVCRLPGYLRGLAFYGRFAFIGLCKIRETNLFGGLPIQERLTKLDCGVHIVDITTGASVGFLQFTKGIEELFDIQILPGVFNPHVIGFEEDTIDGLYIFPST